MKETIRYVTFDGSIFEYKEDAEYYEIKRRLQVKRDILASIVGDYMRRLYNARKRINNIQTYLSEFKKKFHDPDDPENQDPVNHFYWMTDRMKNRAILSMQVLNVKNIKQELARYNRLLSATDNDIIRYKDAHDVIVANRYSHPSSK